MLWLEKGELDKASGALKKCLQLAPKYALGLIAMGNLLFEYEECHKAAKYYQQALGMNPH